MVDWQNKTAHRGYIFFAMFVFQACVFLVVLFRSPGYYVMQWSLDSPQMHVANIFKALLNVLLGRKLFIDLDSHSFPSVSCDDPKCVFAVAFK